MELYDFLWKIITETNLGGLALFLITIAMVQAVVYIFYYISNAFKNKRK